MRGADAFHVLSWGRQEHRRVRASAAGRIKGGIGVLGVFLMHVRRAVRSAGSPEAKRTEQRPEVVVMAREVCVCRLVIDWRGTMTMR